MSEVKTRNFCFLLYPDNPAHVTAFDRIENWSGRKNHFHRYPFGNKLDRPHRLLPFRKGTPHKLVQINHSKKKFIQGPLF